MSNTTNGTATNGTTKPVKPATVPPVVNEPTGLPGVVPITVPKLLTSFGATVEGKAVKPKIKHTSGQPLFRVGTKPAEYRTTLLSAEWTLPTAPEEADPRFFHGGKTSKEATRQQTEDFLNEFLPGWDGTGE